MKKSFEVNNETGELKVFTEDGYILVTPYYEGVSVELYKPNLKNGSVSDKDGMPGLDLAIIENYDGEFRTHVWEDTSREDYTVSTTHHIVYDTSKIKK